MVKNKSEASGSIAGFLFQPDRALLHLSQLKDRDHYITIEYIDDVGVHDELDRVLISEQDKHSIKRGGSTFQNSSLDLWKTFVIWITSFDNGLVNEKTKFICSTNKKINTKSFLYEFPKCSLGELEDKVKNFLKEKNKSLENKLKEARSQGKNTKNIGSILKPLIKNIEIVQNNIEYFHKIVTNLIVEDEQTIDKLKDSFLNHIQRPRNSELSDRVYDELLGWLHDRCKDLWEKQKEAVISKEQFNERIDIINSAEVLNQLIFRARDEINDELGESVNELEELYSDKLFVKQIDLVDRYQKRSFILEAINDYLCYEKEEYRISEKGTITSSDFQKFTDNNEKRWKDIFLTHVTSDPKDMSESEQKDLAIKIYDEVMKLSIKFKDIYEINISNKYIKTGSFHKLADIPKIGWHPDWEDKFKKNEN